MEFSSTTSLYPHILPNHIISEKIPPKNRSEDMALTADGRYNMWNSFSKLEKDGNLQG